MTGTDRYRFGVFDFDGGALELRKAQRLVRLRPQALKLLRLLVRHHRQLVSREDIYKELWGPDVFVDFEQGVNHSVKQLRAALGDDAEMPRYIETVPRRGYRFIAPVEAAAATADLTPPAPPAAAESTVRGHRPGRWLIVAGCAALSGVLALAVISRQSRAPTLPSNPTLAVLPFEIVDTTGDTAYLGLGLADAVIARLSADGHVRVRPTASIQSYDTPTVDFKQVGQHLRVEYILTGTVRLAGTKGWVRLQLVHADTNRPVWARTIRVDGPDPMSLERAVTDGARSAFHAELPPSRLRGRTDNPAAHQAYLQGRASLPRLTREGTLAAVAAFERALEMDSKYALAHAGLAKASAQMTIRFAAPSDVKAWTTRAEQHARRALELEGTLAEAHEALAAVARSIEFNWDRAIEQSMEALRLNPSLDLPHHYLASALQHLGRLEMVEEETAAGLEANPLNLAEALRLRGTTALWSGRFTEARMHFERLRDLSSTPVSSTPLAQAVYYTGETVQAEAMLAGLRASAQSAQRGKAMLASFIAARGDTRAALALVAEVQSGDYTDHHVAYSLGATYAGLGRPAEAFRWLRQAAATGFLCYPWYLTDPLLRPLREHHDFQPFMADVKSTADRIATESLRTSLHH